MQSASGNPPAAPPPPPSSRASMEPVSSERISLERPSLDQASLERPSLDDALPRQFGKYTLLGALASGGMASVYLAIQRAVAGFEKLVVIKRILPELARDTAFVEMLLKEARTAATLNHPNVVQTFDVGEVEGTYFIAMEHINGEDIRSIVRAMKRCRVTEFPLEHALNIVLGVCAGLAYAHEKKDLKGASLGIVHRDISPQNVLITFSGDVKIVDFGIAKSTAAIGENTGAGQLKGKVPYMSPEQARGQEIDHRSDVFAVGIMLFELTTGRRLFKAKSEFETLKLICEREYPRPSLVRPSYPLQLENIVMRALSKDPGHRYQSARDMQADLEEFIRDQRIAVSTVSLSNWMKFLFEEKIAQQSVALQDVKQLADVIASQASHPADLLSSTETSGGATISDTDIGAYTAVRRRNNMIWAAIAVLGLAVGGAGLFVATRKTEVTAPPEPTAEPSETVKKPRGNLTVTSDPDGAYIRVAGELHGAKTPTTLDDLPLGMELDVKISKEGFEDHLSKITLSEDKQNDSIDVKLVRGTVTFVFKVDHPKNAYLTFDGKRWKGEGNTLEGLSTGEHKAVFTAPGYAPQVVKFVAKKGETKKVAITLQKASEKPPADAASGGGTETNATPKQTGTLNINSRGGFCSNVVVGGRSVGPTPVAGVVLPEGPVGITCTTADGRKVRSGAMIKPNTKNRATVSIPKK